MANEVEINIQADGSGAVKGIEQVQTGFGKMGAAFEKHRKKIAIGMTALGGGLTALAATQIKSAQDEAIGIAKLDQALKNVGSSYDATSAAIEKQLAATQASTNYGDEVQREVLARLVQVIGDEEKALAALPAVLDASASSGKSATTVAETMSKFFAGLANTSDATGVSIEATAGFTERLAKVMGAVGGQAAATVDPLIQLKNETSDLGQEFGRVLLPLLEEIVPPMTNLIRNITAWAKENPKLAATIAKLALGLGAFLAIVGPLLLALPTLVASIKLLAIAFGALSLSMGPITAIVLGLTAAIGAGIIVWKNWDKIIAGIKKGFTTFAVMVSKAVNGILKMTRNVAALVPGMDDLVASLDESITKNEELQQSMLDAADAAMEQAFRSADAGMAIATQAVDTSGTVQEANTSISGSYTEMASNAQLASQDVIAAEHEMVQELKKERMSWADFMEQHLKDVADAEQQAMVDRIKANINYGSEIAAEMKRQSEEQTAIRADALRQAALDRGVFMAEDPWLEETGKTQRQIFEQQGDAIRAKNEAEMRPVVDPIKESLKLAGVDQYQLDLAKRTIQFHAGMSARTNTSAEPVGTALFTEFANMLGPQQAAGPMRVAYEALAQGVERLANGGIVRSPTLAMIGERGPEAVIPLNRSGAGGINVNITVNGDIVSDDFEQRVTSAVRDAVLGGGFTGVLARA